MKSFEFLKEDDTDTKSARIYIVRPGDTLERLARKNDTTVDGLMWLNPQISDSSKITVGYKLRVPNLGNTPDVSPPNSDGKNKLPTGGKTSPEFNKKLQQVADKLGINVNDLYKIIKIESAGSFSPSSHDPNNVSVGLIGFTEPTANRLGTSKAELAQMSAVDQLDYVYNFYKMVGAKPGDDVGTLYMRTFMPAFVNSPDNTVLGQKGGGTLMLPSGKSSKLSMNKIWQQNPAFGKSQGQDSFTVGDVKRFINSR
jgi:LysM repeat protein